MGGRRGHCQSGWLNPDGAHDNDVASEDEKSRQDEQGDGHQRQVELPLPRRRQVDPALHLTLHQTFFIKDEHRRREDGAENPRRSHQQPRSPPFFFIIQPF